MSDEKIEAAVFGRYKVETVIMKDGIDEHIFRRVNAFPYIVKHDGESYKITTDALFEIEINRLKMIKNLAFLIRREYMIIFREGDSQPLIRFDSEISPRVLKVARTSTAVKGMIREWFSGGRFPVNKWLFILIVASIGTFIYAKLSGMI